MEDGGARMRQSATRQLFRYWNELRGGRAAPERDSIDPAAIVSVLPDTFILEVDPAFAFPFRLVGARTNALFDAQLKSSSFVELWRPQDRAAVRAMLLTTLDGACPVVAGASAAAADRAPVELELLVLPLRHFGKTHARLLGCLTPARHPPWFGLMPAQPLELISMRVVRPDQTTLLKKSESPAHDARRRFVVLPGGRN